MYGADAESFGAVTSSTKGEVEAVALEPLTVESFKEAVYAPSAILPSEAFFPFHWNEAGSFPLPFTEYTGVPPESIILNE